MEFNEVIKGRRSVRSFLDAPVENEKILDVINAAQWAPSACNKQLWEFVVVRDRHVKERLVDEAGADSFLKNTPVAIYVLYPKDVNPEGHANVQSASAAIENMLLTAHNVGLGAVWVVGCGGHNKVRKILNIPERFLIVAAVFMGYPAEKQSPPERRDISTIVHTDRYVQKKQKYASVYPEDWDFDALRDYRMRGIRATSPFPYAHRPPFRKEFKKEVELTTKSIKSRGKLLDVLSFGGAHVLELLKDGNFQEVHVFEMADSIAEFIDKKKQNVGITKNIMYEIGNPYQLPYKDAYFDAITCFKRLELLPHPEKLVAELGRALKKDGSLILSFWNSRSIPGLYYKIKTGILHNTRVTSHDGPVRPMSFKKVKKILVSSGFKIKQEYGINLVPNRGIGRFLDMAGYVTSGVLKSFCRTILVKCEKK